MGVKNYLIEGVSGAGKTTVAEELERRGYHVIHGDRVLGYRGDPETGEPVDLNAPEGADDPQWCRYTHWIWPVDKVKAIIADQSHPQTFFCGGSRNHHHFIDLFDEVFVLDVDLDTINRRVTPRGDDEYGGTPEQRALIARVHASREGLPANAVRIDSGRPVAIVADEILARCRPG